MKTSRRMSILIVLWSIILTLFAIEVFLRATVHMSGFYGGAIENDWMREHWTPINSLGYRDVEPYSADLTNVLVVGDSFMAGYGIENASDRLAGVLQSTLGSEYGVNVAAQIAWETPREFEALQAYPVQPEIVVWSHFANDILWTYPNYPDVYPREILSYASNQSYLTTFLYRVFVHPTNDPLVRDTYRDPIAVDRHLNELQTVIDYCTLHDIELIFVLWDLPGHHETVPTIAAYLDTVGARYLDTDTFEHGLPLSAIAASPLDGHPNAAMHAEAARRVYEMILNR